MAQRRPDAGGQQRSHGLAGDPTRRRADDIDEALLLADRIVLMTNGPGARVCEIVENTLPRERTRSDMHTHANYYPMRNHLVEFLVNRSKRFREEISASSYDPRHPPVVRPGAAPEKPGATKWAS